MPVPQTGPVAGRLRVREIDDDGGRRLVRIVRRDGGPVVTWRRPQMVLLSAQGMDVAGSAKVAFTSEGRVRDVIHSCNADGFSSPHPQYKGGRPPKFTLGQRREITKITKSHPADHGLPFPAWSLAKLAEFLVAAGVVRRHFPRGPAHAAPRGGRQRSAAENLESPHRPALRGEEGAGGASVCDRRRSSSAWTSSALEPAAPARPRATAADARHLPAHRGGAAPVRRLRAGRGQTVRHIKPRKTRARFLEFCRCLRSLYPPDAQIAIICGNFSPHLTTRKDKRAGQSAANNTQIACTPTNCSWSNRIEAHFTALRYSAPGGTGHATHQEQGSMIRRYIIWRNNHAHDQRLRRIIARANVA